jgi:hypothetical protein
VANKAGAATAIRTCEKTQNDMQRAAATQYIAIRDVCYVCHILLLQRNISRYDIFYLQHVLICYSVITRLDVGLR